MRKHVIGMSTIRIGNETGETMETSWKIDWQMEDFNRNESKKPVGSGPAIYLKMPFRGECFVFLQFITELIKLTPEKFIRLHPLVNLFQGTVDRGVGSAKKTAHF